METVSLMELGDRLAMFATQIKESAEGQGEPPHVFHLDDWLSDYRAATGSDLYKDNMP